MKEKTWDMLRKMQKKVDEKGRVAACKHEIRLQLVRMKKYEPFEYGELNIESTRETEEEATKRRYYFDETKVYPYPNLVKRRRKLAMSQTDVERAIGVGQKRYAGIERGTIDVKNVPEDMIRSIENLFKKKAEWLFYQNDEMRTQTEALREKRELREAVNLNDGSFCPECLSGNTSVLERRLNTPNDQYQRRRVCNDCNVRWSTVEVEIEELRELCRLCERYQ